MSVMNYLGLVLLVLITHPLSPLPRQAINKQAENSSRKPAAANQGNNAANAPTPARTGTGCDANTYNTYNFAAEAHPEAAKQPDSWSRTDKLTAVYDGLTGLLVFVAAGTGFVIWKQTQATTRAANISRRALIASLRPKLVVKRISIIPGKLEGG